MIWDNLREEEFDEAIEKSGGLCIIPLGCLEKHGQHLPVGTDYFEAMTVVERAAREEEVVIFPVGAWLGEVSCFHSFKNPKESRLRGCIGLKPSTVLTVLEELCDEIARNGFRKILIVNSHGGNIAMLRHFIRSQTYENKPYATLSTFALDFSGTEAKRLLNKITNNKKDFPYITARDIEVLKEYSKEGYGGGHADFRETSMILAYDENLVAEDKYEAENGISNHRTDYLSNEGIDAANIWLANYPNSYNGFAPHGASKAIGEAMIQLSVKRLKRIFKLLKEDEDCVRIASMLNKE
jgi:creatinine amidohydrolase